MQMKEEGDKGKEVVITVNAPWTDGEEKVTLGLQMIAVAAKQLMWYLESGQSPNPEYTQRDLDAYRVILERNDEELAKRFMQTKHEAIIANKRFKDNWAVLKHLGVECDSKQK